MFMEPLQKRIIFTCFGEVISGVLRDIMMGNGDEETISSTISIIVARTEMVLY